MPPVFPRRPAEKSSLSARILRPDFKRSRSASDFACGSRSMVSTASPRMISAPMRSSESWMELESSSSVPPSIRSRPSTSVMRVPSAAKRHAYSVPMTPPPTTVIEVGTRSRFRMLSLSTTSRSFDAMPRGADGDEPVAMSRISACSLRITSPRASRTATVRASSKTASPKTSATEWRSRLRRICRVCRSVTSCRRPTSWRRLFLRSSRTLMP